MSVTPDIRERLTVFARRFGMQYASHDRWDLALLMGWCGYDGYYGVVSADADLTATLHSAFDCGVEETSLRLALQQKRQEMRDHVDEIAHLRLLTMLDADQAEQFRTDRAVQERSRFTGYLWRISASFMHSVRILHDDRARLESIHDIRLQMCLTPAAVTGDQLISPIDVITSCLAAIRSGDEGRLLKEGVPEVGYRSEQDQQIILDWIEEQHHPRDPDYPQKTPTYGF